MAQQNDPTVVLEADPADENNLVETEIPPTSPEETPAEDPAEADEAEAGTKDDEDEEPASPATPADAKAKDAPSTLEVIKNDPYDFDRCQMQVSLLFLPRSGSEPRMVVCGVKTHDDDPLIEVIPGDEVLATLPAAILELIEKVKVQLPTRAMERMAKKQAPANKKRTKPTAVPAVPAKITPPASVKAPNAPALGASVSQPDLFSLLGGAK